MKNAARPWLKIAIPPYDPPVSLASSRPVCHAPRKAPGGALRKHVLCFDSECCRYCGLPWDEIVNWGLECVILHWPDGTPVKERDYG